MNKRDFLIEFILARAGSGNWSGLPATEAREAEEAWAIIEKKTPKSQFCDCGGNCSCQNDLIPLNEEVQE